MEMQLPIVKKKKKKKKVSMVLIVDSKCKIEGFINLSFKINNTYFNNMIQFQ